MSFGALLRRALGAGSLALLFAIELLGTPRWTNRGGEFETAARRLDRMLAERRFADALTHAEQMRARWPDAPIADRQVARALAGLGRTDEEVRAWAEFLRHSPVVADACLRLAEIGRQHESQRCFEDPFENREASAR